MAYFSKMVSFLRKNRLFQRGPSHPKLNFFQILKKQSSSTNTQDLGVSTFFLYENLSFDRDFSSIELFFGLSHFLYKNEFSIFGPP
jgi:hypothetical protein